MLHWQSLINLSMTFNCCKHDSFRIYNQCQLWTPAGQHELNLFTVHPKHHRSPLTQFCARLKTVLYLFIQSVHEEPSQRKNRKKHKQTNTPKYTKYTNTPKYTLLKLQSYIKKVKTLQSIRNTSKDCCANTNSLTYLLTLAVTLSPPPPPYCLIAYRTKLCNRTRLRR